MDFCTNRENGPNFQLLYLVLVYPVPILALERGMWHSKKQNNAPLVGSSQ